MTARGTNAINQLVNSGKYWLKIKFPGQEFSAKTWNINAFKTRSSSGYQERVKFTRYRNEEELLPECYAEVIKAWMIELAESSGNLVAMLNAAKVLWEAILINRQGQVEAFNWANLSTDDFSLAEDLMLEEWAERTTYERMLQLGVLVRKLVAREICYSSLLEFTPTTANPKEYQKSTLESQTEDIEKLPSDRAIKFIPYIYHHATEPSDRLLAAICGLLMITGWRVSEVLTMPENCERSEVRAEGKRVYGLFYYPEKQRHPEYTTSGFITWLTSEQEQLARHLIAEIRVLTQKARTQAIELEKNLNNSCKVPLPQDFFEKERMSPEEVAQLLGYKDGRESAYKLTRKNKLVRHQDKNGFYYLVKDVKDYLSRERVEGLWTIKLDGLEQKLSETLFITFKNFFRSVTGTNSLLVEPVTKQQVAYFLKSQCTTKSAFERYGLRDYDGRFCEMNSHQFRHWNTTTLFKAGVDKDTLTLWRGYRDLTSIESYLHISPKERFRRIQKARGIEVLLRSETHLGKCCLDLSKQNCPFFLECSRGCPNFVYVKGERKYIESWQQIKLTAQSAISRLSEFAASGVNVAPVSMQKYQQTLVNVETVLAIEDNPLIANDTEVQPFKSPLHN